MKIDITKILLFIILAILGWNLVSGLFNTEDVEKDLLREQLVQQSKLIKSGEGRYEKLLDDYHDQKSLLEELKSSNKDLYKDIKKSNEEIVALTLTTVPSESDIDEIPSIIAAAEPPSTWSYGDDGFVTAITGASLRETAKLKDPPTGVYAVVELYSTT